MDFFTRLSNGWRLSMNSFRVLRENKQLILFPILSGVALILIMASFMLPVLGMAGWDVDNIADPDTFTTYLLVFLYYVVNYFVVVFFNMALIHCTRLYFHGEEVTIGKGIAFAKSRIGVILSWAIFAATVGTILKAIQENAGWLGRLITGILGVVWGIATFFVVPIIAYENAGPITAFKRSSQLMRQKWGESLGATFSFGLIQLLAMLLVAVPLLFIGGMIHIMVGIILAILGAFVVLAVMSAAETIFVSAVYHNINNDPVKHFNEQMLNNLFEKK
ncbi:MAG TPA: DUF6159 family protein [Chitinophagaceae bacterium]|nr:DUF6159 family protein [Chitinophagaceae bacterium]